MQETTIVSKILDRRGNLSFIESNNNKSKNRE